MAYMVMAYIVMACIFMACIVMAYIVMTYMIMAYTQLWQAQQCARYVCASMPIHVPLVPAHVRRSFGASIRLSVDWSKSGHESIRSLRPWLPYADDNSLGLAAARQPRR